MVKDNEIKATVSPFAIREGELKVFDGILSNPHGIILVTGPTGSGKSTTLQRNMIKMIQEHNGEINVITVEDPPEYPIPGARQMPVTNANTEEQKNEEKPESNGNSLNIINIDPNVENITDKLKVN